MALSPRLTAIVDALPLRRGMRILEIGCGSGAAARALARRIGTGHIVGIDRSARAIDQARRSSAAEIREGIMSFRHAAIESFVLEPGEPLFDLAFAIRVGALDGRYPELEERAHARISEALKTNGRFFVDGGNPLKEVKLKRPSV